MNLGTNMIQGSLEDIVWKEPESFYFKYYYELIAAGVVLSFLIVFGIYCLCRQKEEEEDDFEEFEKDYLKN